MWLFEGTVFPEDVIVAENSTPWGCDCWRGQYSLKMWLLKGMVLPKDVIVGGKGTPSRCDCWREWYSLKVWLLEGAVLPEDVRSWMLHSTHLTICWRSWYSPRMQGYWCCSSCCPSDIHLRADFHDALSQGEEDAVLSAVNTLSSIILICLFIHSFPWLSLSDDTSVSICQWSPPPPLKFTRTQSIFHSFYIRQTRQSYTAEVHILKL